MIDVVVSKQMTWESQLGHAVRAGNTLNGRGVIGKTTGGKRMKEFFLTGQQVWTEVNFEAGCPSCSDWVYML